MSAEIENTAASLFEKIRARFEDVSVGDEKGKQTQKPEAARFFNFDYSDSSGQNHGNILISLVDEGSLKIFFSRNITKELDDTQKSEWYDFLRDLRMFAKRNVLSFDARDINRESLNVKDLSQLVSANSKVDSNDIAVTESLNESKWSGTTKTSYKPISDSVRLSIRHSSIINDSVQGARTRKIEKIYIETADGQRFIPPCKSLVACEALARHIAEGGAHNDEFWNHIASMSEESKKLGKFCRTASRTQFEDSEAHDIVSAAAHRAMTLRKILEALRGPRGYRHYKDSWQPEEPMEQGDIEPLKEKFTIKRYDERLSDGLGYAMNAYNKQLQEFETWADSVVTEGTWAVPKSDPQIKELNELMSQPLAAGVDGDNATSALYDIIGDDELFDRIYDASRGAPDMDVRPIVMSWLKSNMPEVAKAVEANADLANQDSNAGGENMATGGSAPEAPPAAPAGDAGADMGMGGMGGGMGGMGGGMPMGDMGGDMPPEGEEGADGAAGALGPDGAPMDMGDGTEGGEMGADGLPPPDAAADPNAAPADPNAAPPAQQLPQPQMQSGHKTTDPLLDDIRKLAGLKIR